MRASFFDTNVLIYIASPEKLKRERARAIVEDGGTISVQVLNETANVLRRKMRYDWPAIHEVLASLRALLSVVPVSIETHAIGLGLAERYGLALYDAMIVGAALQQSCDTLWSEDMQDGMVIDRTLRIENPFRR